MSGSTGKRSFADIIRYWVIHNKNLYLSYLLDELRGLFVSTGLASFSSIGLVALGKTSILQRADKEFH